MFYELKPLAKCLTEFCTHSLAYSAVIAGFSRKMHSVVSLLFTCHSFKFASNDFTFRTESWEAGLGLGAWHSALRCYVVMSSMKARSHKHLLSLSSKSFSPHHHEFLQTNWHFGTKYFCLLLAAQQQQQRHSLTNSPSEWGFSFAIRAGPRHKQTEQLLRAPWPAGGPQESLIFADHFIFVWWYDKL